MIKFISHDSNGRTMLGLIISKGNIENLQKGFPIQFNAEDMGIPNISCKEIMICYFETENEAYKHFKKMGYIDENTKIKEEKGPTKQ